MLRQNRFVLNVADSACSPRLAPDIHTVWNVFQLALMVSTSMSGAETVATDGTVTELAIALVGWFCFMLLAFSI